MKSDKGFKQDKEGLRSTLAKPTLNSTAGGLNKKGHKAARLNIGLPGNSITKKIIGN